jgi:hypothetical protein
VQLARVVVATYWAKLKIQSSIAGVQVSSAATDLLELTEENVEKVLDEVGQSAANGCSEESEAICYNLLQSAQM